MGTREDKLEDLFWQNASVAPEERAQQKKQTPKILWLTGLSGAGKSTIAYTIDRKCFELGLHSYVLDGDNVRQGLNRDLRFGDADRVENLRRVAEVARLMADAGLIVIVSFISPFAEERRIARSIAQPHAFYELFIDTPLDVCVARDPKGLYKKALDGKIEHFTGISSPYERPESPDLVLSTAGSTPSFLADMVIRRLLSHFPAS